MVSGIGASWGKGLCHAIHRIVKAVSAFRRFDVQHLAVWQGDIGRFAFFRIYGDFGIVGICGDFDLFIRSGKVSIQRIGKSVNTDRGHRQSCLYHDDGFDMMLFFEDKASIDTVMVYIVKGSILRVVPCFLLDREVIFQIA